MIWHIVRFDCRALEPAVRDDLAARLAALEALDCVTWLRVGPDIDDPAVIGLLSAFEDLEALETYRVHPDHLPVVARVKELGIPVERLDVDADHGPRS